MNRGTTATGVADVGTTEPYGVVDDEVAVIDEDVDGGEVVGAVDPTPLRTSR